MGKYFFAGTIFAYVKGTAIYSEAKCSGTGSTYIGHIRRYCLVSGVKRGASIWPAIFCMMGFSGLP